jgi:hypothetical protein
MLAILTVAPSEYECGYDLMEAAKKVSVVLMLQPLLVLALRPRSCCLSDFKMAMAVLILSVITISFGLSFIMIMNQLFALHIP